MKNTLWLGSQASYEAVLEAKANALARYGDREDEPQHTILDVQGNVGIINISGSLVNGNAGWMCYFGITGYGDIRDALVAALGNPGVHAIMLNIDSGGGAVAGVHETAQLIARVDKLKPVISYTGGTEASAALWLGSSARTAYAAETSMMGSLGILMIHAERSKQLEQDGVKVTIIRAGSEKALANPYEPLSDKAKEALEEQAAAMYDVFLTHVATQRGVSTTVADEKFGQGRVFVGKSSVTAGLADAVGTLEDAYMQASALGAKIATKAAAKGTPSRTSASLNTVNSLASAANMPEVLVDGALAVADMVDNTATLEGNPMPKPLTLEQLAAATAGVDLPTAVVPATAPVAETPATETASTDAPATEATTKPVEIVAGGASELVAFLKDENKALQTEAAISRAALATAEDKLTKMSASLEALAEIGRNSVKTMTVALGGKADSVAALSALDVVAEHTRVSAVFKEKFKVGAVAATTLEEEPAPKAVVSPVFLSAVNSLNT